MSRRAFHKPARPRRHQGTGRPIADLKARIDIAEFYAGALPGREIKARGDGWTANMRCPFHDEDRPSFGVNLRTGAFKCFACGAAGGSAIDFVMLDQGVDLRDAMRILRDQWGGE